MFRSIAISVPCFVFLFCAVTLSVQGQEPSVNDADPIPEKTDKQDKPLSEQEIKKLIDVAINEDRAEQKKKAEEAKAKKEAEEKAKKDVSVTIGDDTTFKAYTNNGLYFVTPDKAFEIHVGGRLHTDIGLFNTANAVEDGIGGVGSLQDGVDFRRARIRVNGTMWENIDWLMEYGFESGSPAFFDVATRFRDMPYVGDFWIGHFREPFSMDALTSGNNLTFIERSLIQDAFVPFRNTGMMVTDLIADDHMMYAFGVYRSNSNAVGDDFGDRNYAVTGRFTFNFGYDKCSKDAVHLGIAGSHRNLPLLNAAGIPSRTGLPRTRLRSRPEFRANMLFLANTGFFQAETQDLIGLEAAWGSGPLLIQSEYVASFVNELAGPGQTGSAFFHGWYVQASYFLTGETRPYIPAIGVFGRAKPLERAFWRRNEGSPCTMCGMGAWEVGARYSYLDLTDSGINGGTLEDLTFGLNWHLNPSCRWMFNYILSWRELPGGSSDGLTRILGARFQIDF